MRRIGIYTVLIITGVSLLGCSRQATELNTFMLEIKDAHAISEVTNQYVLRIGKINASSPFKYKYLVYRTGDMEFETDYYNQFLVRPEDMVVDHVYACFSKRGIFKDVIRRDSLFDAEYELETHIVSLYGDFSEETSFKAVMELEFTFVDIRGEKAKVVFEKTYRSEVPFDSRDARELVKSYGQCLEDILGQVQRDIVKLDLEHVNL